MTDGRAVGKDEVMPESSIGTRLGIVMGNGPDGLGTGNFILASVIDFYDTLREQKEDFFEYPDFYTFQATTDPADYRMFDIYPDHKNVVTDVDAEAVLRAVNDRAIAILLDPDRSPVSPEIEDVTHRSAERRIESCFLYSPRGQLDDHSFVIEAPRQPLGEWFEATTKSPVESFVDENWRTSLENPRRISQEFRQLSLERALEYLPNDDGG